MSYSRGNPGRFDDDDDYYGGDDDDDYGDGGTGGTRINARASGRGRVTVAGRDITSSYFISVSSAVLAGLVGLAVLLAVWKPWHQVEPDDGEKPATGVDAPVKPIPHPDPPTDDDEEDKKPDAGQTTPAPDDSPTTTAPSTPAPSTPAPPDPVDVAFASVRVGTCLNVYDEGWGKLNQDRPSAVDCGASFAFSKVTMVTTYASGCPEGGGRHGWGHVNDDGSSIALCLDRVFATGQCFPAVLTEQADGSVKGTARLFSVWGCDRTQVPKGQNAVMGITALVNGGSCPQRTDRRTLSWTVFNGSAKVCAVQMQH
ncbi:hypothetical protein [Streptomyces sp. ITFR-6]|uniref:hypothetical protein n=1 Tax=Streptomyces sp. ITFR-6 TaxID=3075197 RepID=UPI00288A7DAD|nr:hypothetical protein [Streptomyces sp. ITFR-6]WNI30116.1 hypothetical protein RLT59_15925 [Streptomyces sp. ITFR-6]